MKTRLLRTAGFVLGIAAGLTAGCKRHDDSKVRTETLPAVSVRVQMLEARKRLVTEEVIGTVRAKLQARIEAKMAGRIEQMRAVPGQSVKAGELLVRLDAREISAKLDQAAAIHQQADSELKRTTALLERGAATRSEFDAVQARERVAAAAVKETQTLLGHAEIPAPFDGIVTRKHADVGDLAAPGKSLLELEAPTSLRVEADVGEALIAGIQLGQALTVQVATLPGDITGTVAELAPAADSASRTFLVKLDLPPMSGLRAGSFARVAVPIGEREVLAVPAEAVIQHGQLEYIFVVADNKAHLRLVKTGRRHGQEIDLLAGASAGERVIVSGGVQLQDGQPLQIQP